MKNELLSAVLSFESMILMKIQENHGEVGIPEGQWS